MSEAKKCRKRARTANAVTWDGRAGFNTVTNLSCSSGVITVTTGSTNTFESEEGIYLNSLSALTFLNGLLLSVVNTNQGTTSVQLTAPTFYANGVTNNGTTATYTNGGTMFTGSSYLPAGATVTISGFTNSGNNGTFTVVSATSNSLTVTSSTAVNEANAAYQPIALTSFASTSVTGSIAYLNDGTYTDTMSAVHMYNGFEAWTHPNQLSTILNHFNISNMSVFRTQGDGFTLHGPNYGYADRIEALGGQYGCSGGLCLESAHATTNRYTNPSAFEVRGGNQLYGSCFGFAAQCVGGLNVGMVGINGSGIGIVLDNCSGVTFGGYDLETQTPLSGQTDLWPGNGIELVGGTAIKVGGYMYLGLQDDTEGGSSTSQKCFYAWKGAQAFEYSNACHLGGSGYNQQTYEIYVDNSCSNYKIGKVELTGSTANVYTGGTNYETNINGTLTIGTSGTGGLTLTRTSNTATSGQNYSSPTLYLEDSYWNGSSASVGLFSLQVVPASGANPQETLTIYHSGSSGGSQINYNNNFFVDGGANILCYTSGAATSGANGNSPYFRLASNYWTGSASAEDYWQLQSTLASGSNPASTLTLSHTGSSGSGYLVIDASYVTFNTAQNITLYNSSGTAQFEVNSASNVAQVQVSAVSTATSAPQTYQFSYNGSTQALSLYDSTGGAARIKIADTTGVVTIPTNIASTSTTTGALVVTGGVGINGTIYAGSVYDNGNRVLTGLTAGTAISISGSAPTGVTVTNTGVTSLTGTTNQVSVSSPTGAIILSLPQNINSGAAPTFAGTNFTSIPNSALSNSSITVTGGTGLGVSGSPVSLGGTVTLSNTGVTSAVAGTDISVSGPTSAVTISATSTLATVTGRGATTATALSITNSTASSSPTTGALVVTGGVGVGGISYIGNTLYLTPQNTATSGTNYSSQSLYLQDSYYNGSAGATGGFYLQSTPASGTNPVETLNIFHSGSSGGSALTFNSNFSVSGSGYISKYNSLATVGTGMPMIQGTNNATGQTANVAATTITSTTTQAGLYRISAYIEVVQAATTSSTLPDIQIMYTARYSSASKTVQITTGDTGNTVGLSASADEVISCASGTSIQFAIGQNQAYASSGATVMQFAYSIRSEYIG